MLLQDSQTLAADLFSLGLTIYYAISGGKQLFPCGRHNKINRFLERHQDVHEGCQDILHEQPDAFNELHADGNFFLLFLSSKLNSMLTKSKFVYFFFSQWPKY